MSKTRKHNGDGSVFQVSENKWVAKICMGTRPDGKPNIKQFSGKTESSVRKKLRDFKKSDDFAEKHVPRQESVSVYFSAWLRDAQYNKLKPSSYDRLEQTVEKQIIPHLGGMRIDKVTRTQIQTLINTLYTKQMLSYSSVKKTYDALNACFKYALMDDIVTKNPCVGVVLPAQSERSKQVISFTDEQVERFKAELQREDTKGNPLYAYKDAFLLILNTGLRMGEALSLRWDDIDFDKRQIHVYKTGILTKKRDREGRRTGGYQLTVQDSPKTSHGNRTIPMNKTTEALLRAMRENSFSQFVVANSRGKQVLASNFERSFHAVLRNADIPECGVHTLRHTFASLLFKKGVDVKIVSQLLGHSTVKITYDIYVHLFEKDIHDAIQVLD